MNNLTIIETILRDRGRFFAEIREGLGILPKIQAMLLSCFVFLAVYGLVMGASRSAPQALSAMIKLPILFLLTLAICAPSLHFFNILFGSKQTILQTIALILTAISTSSVLLFSVAPITLFFLLTNSGYQFYKLLNVVFFIVAGSLGAVFLRQGMHVVTELEGDDGIQTRRMIFYLWVLVYGFVGSQMAWTISPFMGNPHDSFMLMKPLGGNVYTDILNALRELLEH